MKVGGKGPCSFSNAASDATPSTLPCLSASNTARLDLPRWTAQFAFGKLLSHYESCLLSLVAFVSHSAIAGVLEPGRSGKMHHPRFCALIAPSIMLL